MIGLDTNVVVRYLVQDDPRQSATATPLIERELSPDRPGVLTAVVLCEIAWVLEESYETPRPELLAILEGLLGVKQLVVEQAEPAWRALRAARTAGADFSDALIGQVVAAHGGKKTVTFDRAAARLPGFELLA